MSLFANLIDAADCERQPELSHLFDVMQSIHDQLLDAGHSPDAVSAAMIGVGIDGDVRASSPDEAARNLQTMAIIVNASSEAGSLWRH